MGSEQGRGAAPGIPPTAVDGPKHASHDDAPESAPATVAYSAEEVRQLQEIYRRSLLAAPAEEEDEAVTLAVPGLGLAASDPTAAPAGLVTAPRPAPGETADLHEQGTTVLPAVAPELLAAAARLSPRPVPGMPAEAPATVHLAQVDPALLALQQQYQEQQDLRLAAEQEEQRRLLAEEAAEARRLRRKRQLTLAIGIVGASLLLLLLVWAGFRLFAPPLPVIDGRTLAVLNDPVAERASLQPRTAAERRLAAEQQLAGLAALSWDAVREGDRAIARAERLLGAAGTARPVRAAYTETLGLARQLREIRREVLSAKVALAGLPDERVAGTLADTRRLRDNLIEVRARLASLLDDLLESHPELAHVPRPESAAAPVGGEVPRPRQQPLGSPAASSPAALSDEALIAKVLGSSAEGPIWVEGLPCPCPPDALQTAAATGAELEPCTLRACWKVGPGHAHYDEVFWNLAKLHGAKRQPREQLAALIRATSYGRYSHDPLALFTLLSAAARQGQLRVAVEARDRFLGCLDALSPEQRAARLPEAFRIVGEAFEWRFRRMHEDNPARADPALLTQAIDCFERYADYAGKKAEILPRLHALQALRQETEQR